MKILQSTALYLAVGLITPALITQSAQAKIKCQGSFQVIKGNGVIATPYCQDEHLASVAREFGVRVSSRSIRQNPNKKKEVCALVGFDNRIKEACTGYLPEDNGGGH